MNGEIMNVDWHDKSLSTPGLGHRASRVSIKSRPPTTTGSQALGEVRPALLTCSCGSSSQVVCRATFNSSVVLGFSWSLWYFSSMAPQM